MADTSKKARRKSKLVPGTYVDNENNANKGVQQNGVKSPEPDVPETSTHSINIQNPVNMDFSVDIEVEEFQEDWIIQLNEAISQKDQEEKTPLKRKLSCYYNAAKKEKKNTEKVADIKYKTKKIDDYNLQNEVVAIDRTTIFKTTSPLKHQIEMLIKSTILESPYTTLQVTHKTVIHSVQKFYCTNCDLYLYQMTKFQQHLCEIDHKCKGKAQFCIIPKDGNLELHAFMSTDIKIEEDSRLANSTVGPLLLFCKNYDYAIWTVYMRWTSQYFCAKQHKILCYKCYPCKTQFEHLYLFKQHLNLHHNIVKLFISSETVVVKSGPSHICITATNSLEQEYLDLGVHVDLKVYKCLRCKIITSELNTYNAHIKKIHECIGCYVIMSCDQLRRHEGFCKPFLEMFYPKCCPCGKQFMDKKKMDDHQITCKFGRTTLAFHCTVCKFLAPSAARLYSHQRIEHAVRSDEFAHIDKVYKCEKCKEIFNYAKTTHKCDEKHKCEFCSVYVGAEYYYTLHLDKNVRPVTCDICMGAFRRQCELKIHKTEKHNMELCYKCLECKMIMPIDTEKRSHVKANPHEGISLQEHMDKMKIVLRTPGDYAFVDDEPNNENLEEVNIQEVSEKVKTEVYVSDSLDDRDDSDCEKKLEIAENDDEDAEGEVSVNSNKVFKVTLGDDDKKYFDDDDEQHETETDTTDNGSQDSCQFISSLEGPSGSRIMFQEEIDYESFIDDSDTRTSVIVKNEIDTDEPVIKAEPVDYNFEESSTDIPEIHIKEEDLNDDSNAFLSNVFQVSKELLAQASTFVKIKEEPEFEEDDLIIRITEEDNDPDSVENFIRENPEISNRRFNKPPPKVYNCKRCSFSGLYTPMKLHLKTCRISNTPRKLLKYKCIICDSKFDDLRQYLRHLESYHDYKQNECPYCRSLSVDPKNIQQHILSHIKSSFRKVCFLDDVKDGEMKKFKCVTCKSIITEELFFEHWQTHFKEPIKEEVIEEPSTSKSEVRVNKFKPIATNKVSASVMKLEDDMLAQIIEMIRMDKVPLRTCLLCSKEFLRNFDCKRHLIEHLLRDAYATKFEYLGFKCQICNEVSAKIDGYKRHMREHAMLPLYQCQMCDKSFSDSSNFGKHKKVHNLYVMDCQICGRKFQCEAQLKKHLVEHSKNKKIQCTRCDKIFHFPSTYKKHCKSAHNDCTSYKCKICLATFPSIRAKWDHEWDAHKERKQDADCPICKISFRRFADAKVHIKNVHGISVEKSNYKFLQLMNTMNKLDLSVDDIQSLIDERNKAVQDSDSD